MKRKNTCLQVRAAGPKNLPPKNSSKISQGSEFSKEELDLLQAASDESLEVFSEILVGFFFSGETPWLEPLFFSVGAGHTSHIFLKVNG